MMGEMHFHGLVQEVIIRWSNISLSMIVKELTKRMWTVGHRWPGLSFSHSPKTVEVLVNSGLVNVNKKDNNGRSALSFAAAYGYLDVVQLLLSKDGIEIDSQDNDGRTPLSHAARHPDVIEALQHCHK